jgi:hypothetical protein
VGVTAVSREVPGREPVTRDNDDDDYDDDNRDCGEIIITLWISVQCIERVLTKN